MSESSQDPKGGRTAAFKVTTIWPLRLLSQRFEALTSTPQGIFQKQKGQVRWSEGLEVSVSRWPLGIVTVKGGPSERLGVAFGPDTIGEPI